MFNALILSEFLTTIEKNRLTYYAEKYIKRAINLSSDEKENVRM